MTSISANDSGPQVSATLASAMRNAHDPLRATIERSGSMVLLRVGGEVDAHNVVGSANGLTQGSQRGPSTHSGNSKTRPLALNSDQSLCPELAYGCGDRRSDTLCQVRRHGHRLSGNW
jgi:hypothetical protein